MAAVQKPRFTKKVILFTAAGLATLVFYLIYFAGTLNVADLVRQINPLYYSSAFLVFVISVFFSSLTWHSLLGTVDVRISVWKALTFTWVGLFFDSVVPDQAGVVTCRRLTCCPKT